MKKVLHFKFKNNPSFTLLEFLIYIFITGVILLVAGGIALNILFAKAKLMTIEEISQNARFAMEMITGRVRKAESINSPAESSSSATLSLEMPNSAEDPTVFDLSSGVLRIKEGTGEATDLTSSEVAVTDLNFSNISYPDTKGTVRIQMTIKFNNPGNLQEYNFEKTFYTTENIYENSN